MSLSLDLVSFVPACAHKLECYNDCVEVYTITYMLMNTDLDKAMIMN
jgi:hypothetical protein